MSHIKMCRSYHNESYHHESYHNESYHNESYYNELSSKRKALHVQRVRVEEEGEGMEVLRGVGKKGGHEGGGEGVVYKYDF